MTRLLRLLRRTRRRRRERSIWIGAKFAETVVVVVDHVDAIAATAAVLVHLARRSRRTSVGQERHDRDGISVSVEFTTGRRISSYARACSSGTRQVRDIAVVFASIVERRRVRKAVQCDVRLRVGERRTLVLD